MIIEGIAKEVPQRREEPQNEYLHGYESSKTKEPSNLRVQTQRIASNQRESNEVEVRRTEDDASERAA